MTFLKPKLLSLLTALLVGTFAAYAAEWIQPQGNPGEWNVDAPVNVGLETQTKQGGLELNGLRSFLPAYVNYDSTVDLTAKPSTFQDLGLAVSGKVGADSYCDADGGNCVDASTIATSTVWSQSGDDIYNTNTQRVMIGTNPQTTGLNYSYRMILDAGHVGNGTYTGGGLYIHSTAYAQAGLYSYKDSSGCAVCGQVDGGFGQGVYGMAPYGGEGIYGGARDTGINHAWGVYGEVTAGDGWGVVGKGRGTGGDFYARGGGSTRYGSASSRRWKHNISTMQNVLEKINKIRGVDFTWNEDRGGRKDIGFIAEEVGKVFPEAVTYEENGVDADAVDYTKFSAVAIQGINELIEENKSLKQEINDLKKEIEYIKEQIKSR